MARTDPLRWTPDEIRKLVEVAGKDGVTLEGVGRQYGVSASQIQALLKRAGVNKELSKKRKREQLEKKRDEMRALVSEALAKANGSVREAARLTSYSITTMGLWARRLLAKDGVEKLKPKRACIECGSLIVSTHPRAKLCSVECKRRRTNMLRAKKRSSGWELWRERDYDELVNTLRLCGGIVWKAARVLGVTRHTAQSAVTRWGLRGELEQMRADDTAEKVRQVAQLMKGGAGMMQAARMINANRKKIKALLIENGYAEVIGTQKCPFCGNFFLREKVQDRCCSEGCKDNLMRERWKKTRLRRAAIKARQKAAKGDIAKNKIIQRSKHL